MKPAAFLIQLSRAFAMVFLLGVASNGYALSFGDSHLPDFTKLVEQNSAAVVNISTTQKIKRHHGMPPGMKIPDIPENSPFGDFLRRFFGEQGHGGQMEEFESQSLGSGFIIDADGYVITNNHVVRDADEIIVRLSDRRELKAKLVGTDPRSDVALLKVDATDLPVVKIGDSDKLKVGEWVMAIGSPFGFDHSVSVGVVSAIGRNLPRENYTPFIQTDVAINPGNSGGPLFNLKGEVVGINSQIYSRTGGFMGLSFAIPVDEAMSVVKQLKTTGKVSRGWLGILIQDVNRELAESFGMKKPEGALVLRVMENSPAAKAGFKDGDVVVEFNGKHINRSSDLPLAVGRTAIGSEANVKIVRESRNKTLHVKIAELPTDAALAKKSSEKKPSRVSNVLGLEVQALSAEQKKQLNEGDRGVLVSSVDKGPAKNAGIRSGDVILKLNHQAVKSPKQFARLMKSLPRGKSVPILVQRGDSPVYLPLKVPAKDG